MKNALKSTPFGVNRWMMRGLGGLDVVKRGNWLRLATPISKQLNFWKYKDLDG